MDFPAQLSSAQLSSATITATATSPAPAPATAAAQLSSAQRGLIHGPVKSQLGANNSQPGRNQFAARG